MYSVHCTLYTVQYDRIYDQLLVVICHCVNVHEKLYERWGMENGGGADIRTISHRGSRELQGVMRVTGGLKELQGVKES